MAHNTNVRAVVHTRGQVATSADAFRCHNHRGGGSGTGVQWVEARELFNVLQCTGQLPAPPPII